MELGKILSQISKTLEESSNTSIWTEIKCMNLKKRSRHTSLIYQDYIITFGGFNSIPLNDIDIYDINKNIWINFSIKGDNLDPRYGHTMCLTQDHKIIIFGGYNYNQVMKEIGILTVDLSDSISLTIMTRFYK